MEYTGLNLGCLIKGKHPVLTLQNQILYTFSWKRFWGIVNISSYILGRNLWSCDFQVINYHINYCCRKRSLVYYLSNILTKYLSILLIFEFLILLIFLFSCFQYNWFVFSLFSYAHFMLQSLFFLHFSRRKLKL